MKHLNQNKGFTLIEVLLVLTIVILIYTLPLLNLKPLFQQEKIDQFFVQLEKDLLFAQQYAISHNTAVRVMFFHDSRFYDVIPLKTNKTILVRNYDPNIRIVQSTTGYYVTYRSNGNVMKSGTIQIYFEDDIYNVTFMLGKGRFNVTKYK